MYPFSGKGVQINRQSRGQGLSFTRLHFGDLALMKHHPTEHLDIIVSLTDHPFRCFPYHGKGLWQEVIKSSAILQLFSEFIRLPSQRFVRQVLNRGFKLGNHRELRPEFINFTFIGTEKFLKERHSKRLG